ncbi:MAG: hypothetical protein AAGA96_18415 [Verrucomicrobiota bacterium]
MIASSTVRELLEAHGSCRSQSVDEWTGSIALPDSLARFYAEVGPVGVEVKGYGNPTYLPSLAELWDHQVGYRCDGVSGDTLDGWNPDWIVVADEGADPYIFSEDHVLFAHHGEGTWDPGEIYSDLNAMAAGIANLGSVIVDAGSDFTDDDCLVRPKYREEALSRLRKILESSSEAESIVVSAGWG